LQSDLVKLNWQQIQIKLHQAQPGSSAKVAEVIVVSKKRPLAQIRQAIELGITDFGENRVTEIAVKWGGLPVESRRKVTLHMVGRVQSRQARQVAQLCDWVHSVDRIKIAHKLSLQAEKLGKQLQVLVQVNTSGEASKAGYEVSEWFETGQPVQLESLESDLLQMHDLPGIAVRGLMTMAAVVSDQKELADENTRQTFRRLAKLKAHLNKKHPQLNLEHLSIGMSNDYHVAVEEGATMLRIGRGVFGEMSKSWQSKLAQ
jgi:PLP dependent protein